MLEDYGNANWNASKVAGIIADVAAWAAAHNVKLLVGEFGVLKTYAPQHDRAELIRDVRTALEAHGIAWAMWDYDNAFGLFIRQDPAAHRPGDCDSARPRPGGCTGRDAVSQRDAGRFQ